MEADRNAQMTYKEIANKYCLPLYTVPRLLTEKQSFSSLKLATLEDMFPNARLEFGANRVDNESTIEGESPRWPRLPRRTRRGSSAPPSYCS